MSALRRADKKPKGNEPLNYANPEQRRRLIDGLRELADFFEERPEVPAPIWLDVLTFPPKVTDDEKRCEVDRIAALIGATVNDQTARHLHYTATRTFGPVSYRAVAIPADNSTHPDNPTPAKPNGSV